MQKRRLKRSVKITLISLLILLLLIMLSISFYGYSLSKVNNNANTKEITINQGDAINNIIDKLEKEKLIRNKWAAKVYIKLHGVTNLQAGTYDISSSYSTKEIINIISTGNVSTKNEINITFKEGDNIREYAKVISEKTNNKEIDVFNLLKDSTYIDSLTSEYWFLKKDDIKNPNLYYPLEGYLFPNTYRFRDKNVTVKEIFKSLLDQTNIILSKYKTEIEKKNMNVHEFLTLASLVELEGALDKDKAMITEVFYNRLDAGWSLGSDVTTYYAFKVDDFSKPLDISLYNTSNPYNTRGPNMGGKLPVGPICNPGEASIKAAIEPTESNYFYFVADKNKKVYFSKTDSEQQKKIQELKQAGLWIG